MKFYVRADIKRNEVEIEADSLEEAQKKAIQVFVDDPLTADDLLISVIGVDELYA